MEIITVKIQKSNIFKCIHILLINNILNFARLTILKNMQLNGTFS